MSRVKLHVNVILANAYRISVRNLMSSYTVRLNRLANCNYYNGFVCKWLIVYFIDLFRVCQLLIELSYLHFKVTKVNRVESWSRDNLRSSPCHNEYTAVSRKVVRQNRTRQNRKALLVLEVHGPCLTF